MKYKTKQASNIVILQIQHANGYLNSSKIQNPGDIFGIKSKYHRGLALV